VEMSLLELIQTSLVVVFLAALVWALRVIYRHYQAENLPILFSRMLCHLGIGLKTRENLGLHHHVPTAIRLCQKCRSKAECDAWLEENGHAEPPPEFCANANYLLLLRERQLFEID